MTKRFCAALYLAAPIAVMAIGAALPAHAQTRADSRRAAALQSFAQVPAPAYNWSGFYVGAFGAGAGGKSDQTDPGVPNNQQIPRDGHYAVRGGLGGAGLGFNWQNGAWVYGLEADGAGGRVSGREERCGPTTVTPHPCGTDLLALGMVRGKFGYALGDNGKILFFATGGFAYGRVRAWDALMAVSGTKTMTGWTAGGGVEVGFTPMISGKLEYLYTDLGSVHMFNIVPGVPETVTFRSSVIRAGVNLHFSGQ